MMKPIRPANNFNVGRPESIVGGIRIFRSAIFQLHLVVLLLVALILTACGGGSSNGGSSNDSNIPPTVVIAAIPGPVNEGSTVQLDATGSSDSDGQIVSYAWVQTGGASVTINSANSSLANFVVPAVTSLETLSFRVTVTDDGSRQSSADVSVLVNPSPIADAGSDASATEGDMVTLDGSNSSDDDAIVSYAWSQISGPAVTITNADKVMANFAAPAYTGILQFRLTVTDNNGASDWDDVTVNAAAELYSNSFSSPGDPAGWVEVDDSGTTSLWQVESGKYIQRNLVEFMENPPGSFLESYHRGTFSYYSSGLNWSNYRFSVEIQPIADSVVPAGSQDGNDVGIMFRYRNSTSYYRLSLSASQSCTRLEKRTSSGFETLAVDARGYIEGQTLSVAVSVNSSRMVVYINDEPLFGIDDAASIAQGTIALYCQDRAQFDNVRVTEIYNAPEIAIQAPVNFSVSPTTNGVLQASAVPTFFPAGASIDFILDNSETKTVNGSPYQVAFDNVANGEHSLTAILRGSDGNEISRDTNELIGVGSNHYVTVGNSITNGKYDENAANNVSADGRVVGKQGFQAGLNDLLSSAMGAPVVVFNEGIGGDRTDETYNERIESILDRHPDAKKILILLGTNDSNSDSADTFEANMRALVNYIVGQGKQVWIAKILPIYDSSCNPNTTRNNRIIAYNARIESIAGTTGDNIFLGPDLYSLFDGQCSNYYNSDGIHLNDAGYEWIGQAWSSVLAP